MWLPKGYEAPAAAGGNYLKIKSGDEYKIRILGNFNHPKTAILGWLGWHEELGENRPVRRPYTKDGFDAITEMCGGKPRHFWAVVIWNVTLEQIQIWEITQKTIMDAIRSYTQNSAWGEPTNYNLNVSRKGEGLNDTTYSVIAEPPLAKPAEPVVNAAKAADIDCQKLFDGENPFAEQQAQAAAPVADDIPY